MGRKKKTLAEIFQLCRAEFEKPHLFYFWPRDRLHRVETLDFKRELLVDLLNFVEILESGLTRGYHWNVGSVGSVE
jgi:hypothetical protein